MLPQIKGIWQSDKAKFYFIEDINEATAYLHHPMWKGHTRFSSKLLPLFFRGIQDQNILNLL
ncbi:DUF1810 family protein [Xanthocytophaga flavus]|uniref:DUF1810 family protein n=1 Tax=Xanthocytophaga flava TaxID=3048013 RepID=UPI00391FBBAE